MRNTIKKKKVIIKKIKAIILLIVFIVIFIHIIKVVVNKIKNPDKVSDFLGYSSFIILSGSMKPTFEIGDLVIVKDTKKISSGDIISFYENSSIITHRVVDVIKIDGEFKYKTQGDNNKVADTDLVKQENIIGKYKFKISKIGKIIMFFKTKQGFFLLVTIIFFMPSIKNKKIRRR